MRLENLGKPSAGGNSTIFRVFFIDCALLCRLDHCGGVQGLRGWKWCCILHNHQSWKL